MRPHRPSHPLLNALSPVLPLLHSFLTDADAARLLRTSRAAALALLPGYTFRSHIFYSDNLVSLRRLRDLGLTYSLRVTQLGLPRTVRELTFDSTPPHLSPIPASITALCLGPLIRSNTGAVEPIFSALSAAAGDWQEKQPWRTHPPHPLSPSPGSSWRVKWAVDAEEDFNCLDPAQPSCSDTLGLLDCPIPPGLLPPRLRVLCFNDDFNCPLQLGSLPSTLTFLQLPFRYTQPLTPGVLSAQLLHLTFGGWYRYPLEEGTLPASLESLHLYNWLQPLQAGTLPRGLKALRLGKFDGELLPHVLPSSLLYLSLGTNYNRPLGHDVLPPSLVVLRLSYQFDQMLWPGVLPASLRSLTVGGRFRQPLQPGSLPKGLRFLRFERYDGKHGHVLYLHPLLPGALPSGLLGLDLSDRYGEPLSKGIIPSSVQCVRLSSKYRDENIEAVLPPHAERRWFSHGDNTSWRIGRKYSGSQRAYPMQYTCAPAW